VIVALAFAATPAYAEPIADKRAQAAGIKKQLDRLDSRMEMAVEDYNVASSRLDRLNGKVSDNTTRLRRLNRRIRVLQKSLGVRVSSMYRSGPLGMLDVLLGASSFEDMATTWDLLDKWNDNEAQTVSGLRTARLETKRVAAELATLRTKAKAQFKVVADRRSFIEGQIATRRRLLHGVETEIASLQAAERARARARARAAERARRAARSPSGGWDWGSPSRQPRGRVVSIAMRYLGRPYRWGASGPGSFDCSGFTMFVYAQVGVSLPHSSRAQISRGDRVSRSNLRPGDLVFFGSPIHHVGIYIGGGRMVHSPHTGDVVSIDSIDRGNYAGACRP
jgi:cell wall-associated NlpC family hydrolase